MRAFVSINDLQHLVSWEFLKLNKLHTQATLLYHRAPDRA